jgi:hypothetical protein
MTCDKMQDHNRHSILMQLDIDSRTVRKCLESEINNS